MFSFALSGDLKVFLLWFFFFLGHFCRRIGSQCTDVEASQLNGRLIDLHFVVEGIVLFLLWSVAYDFSNPSSL